MSIRQVYETDKPKRLVVRLRVGRRANRPGSRLLAHPPRPADDGLYGFLEEVVQPAVLEIRARAPRPGPISRPSRDVHPERAAPTGRSFCRRPPAFGELAAVGIQHCPR